jgi:glycosyltransferase involved in cell wall biosynthesis
LPVICSDDCGTKCYIENDRNGYVFKARNKFDLIEKIRCVFIDPMHYESLSKESLKNAIENFNLEDFSNSILKICL